METQIDTINNNRTSDELPENVDEEVEEKDPNDYNPEEERLRELETQRNIAERQQEAISERNNRINAEQDQRRERERQTERETERERRDQGNKNLW